MTQLARWALWNLHVATTLQWCLPRGARLLVAPSNRWTAGHPLDVRHRLAGCRQKQKDLRECEAMIWFYQHDPRPWRPLDDYLLADVAGVAEKRTD